MDRHRLFVGFWLCDEDIQAISKIRKIWPSDIPPRGMGAGKQRDYGGKIVPHKITRNFIIVRDRKKKIKNEYKDYIYIGISKSELNLGLLVGAIEISKSSIPHYYLTETGNDIQYILERLSLFIGVK